MLCLPGTVPGLQASPVRALTVRALREADAPGGDGDGLSALPGPQTAAGLDSREAG